MQIPTSIKPAFPFHGSVNGALRTNDFVSVKRYKTEQLRLADKNLLFSNFPPIIPVFYNERGLLPLYLMAELVHHEFMDAVDPDNMVENLLEVGSSIKGDLTLDHFKSILSQLIKEFIKR